MEFFKRSWAQVQAGLGDLSAEKKIIVALCLVVMLTVLGLWLAWAGNASYVPVPFAGRNTAEVAAVLNSREIPFKMVNGDIAVPSDQREKATAALMENGLMTEDPSDAWSKLIEQQSPWETRAQAEARSLAAFRSYASGVIEFMRGVRKAEVLIAPAPQTGFGDTHLHRTASATVWMEGQRRLNQPMVESIAAFIAGGDARMRARDISVIDGNTGKTHKIDDPDDAIPTEALELVRQQEKQYKEKILELLSIAGLRVAVNVQIGRTHRESQSETEYEKNPPVSQDSSETISRRSVDRGAEPGVRPNVGMTTDDGEATGTQETIESTDIAFATNKVTKQTSTIFTGHQIKKISVSLSVPRQYFVMLYKSRNPDAEGEPDGAALGPIVQERLADFERRVIPIIESDAPGVIVAAMYEDASTLQIASADARAVTGITSMMNSPMGQPMLVGAIVLGVFGMMFLMVRRATRPESLPSVEELAGLPPRLPSDEELIGEVDETEASMTGVELDEGELESRKIADQINDMIRANPDEAGAILGKWVKKDK